LPLRGRQRAAFEQFATAQAKCVIAYDGVPTFSVSVMELTDGFVTHETQYFADRFDAPPFRAPLAEPMPNPS
jgi:hypothetical protein